MIVLARQNRPCGFRKKGSLELTERGASGRREVVRFDLLERPVVERVYDRSDVRGIESRTSYDQWGQVGAVSRPDFEGAPWLRFDFTEEDQR